jgi:hypothetical protein
MKNNFYLQMVALGALIIAAFFLLDPLQLQMPDNVHMATLACVVVLAGIFAAFVLSEGGGDEREEMHRAFAGRLAFFLGAFVLIIGITIQTFLHSLDPWLVYALVVMIVGKVVARIIASRTK